MNTKTKLTIIKKLSVKPIFKNMDQFKRFLNRVTGLVFDSIITGGGSLGPMTMCWTACGNFNLTFYYDKNDKLIAQLSRRKEMKPLFTV